MPEKLTNRQTELLQNLADGRIIVRRGTTLDMYPNLFLKSVNGTERSVMFFTADKLFGLGLVSRNYRITAKGRRRIGEIKDET